MRSKLDIVKGGVARKDLTPVLTHLKIANGWVTSTNGRLTISTPLPELSDMDIIVPATQFIRGVNSCKDPKFSITPGGKLSIKGGKTRILLPLMIDTVFPMPQSIGEVITSSNLLESLNKLVQFIGDDASRPWACGILIYKNMMYSTNNTILAECPVQWDGPAINLPDFLIDELLRLKKEVISIRYDGGSITIELAGDVWLNSSTLPIKWPNIEAMFAKIDFSNAIPVPQGLAKAISDILPFCPDKKLPKIIFTESGVTTESGDQEASIEFEGGLGESSWRAEPLLNLLDNQRAKGMLADFSQYPRPCPWMRSDGVRGVIVGLRK